MRWIQKSNEPRPLVEWRNRYRNDVNFGYSLMRGDHEVVNAINHSLLMEQGSICAYTGRRIRQGSFHIEHLKAQAHCQRGEDVDYRNIVACFPGPNHPEELEYGARKKGDWPSPDEWHLFLSPLERSCEARLSFNLKGEIQAGDTDEAAQQTIQRLGLDHPELTALRREAIRGAIEVGSHSKLRLPEARKRLRMLEQASGNELEPFCFVLIHALKKHIRRLEYIIESQKEAHDNV